jgi:hypothetical protein
MDRIYEVLSVALALVLVACGGNETSSNPDGGHPETSVDLWPEDSGAEEKADLSSAMDGSGKDHSRQDVSVDGPGDLWFKEVPDMADEHSDNTTDLAACGEAENYCQDNFGQPDMCLAWACTQEGCSQVPVTGIECDDGSMCTLNDYCLSGECVGEELDCDDLNSCTDDTCLLESGCLHVEAGDAPCDDGDACTTGDSCVTGACSGEPLDCDDKDPCTGLDCDPASGCSYAPQNGYPCDDGSVCTTGDHCKAGLCLGTLQTCTDGNPCTEDNCDPLEGCQHPPADGAPCNDGNSCTDQDQCVAGLCLGQASGCDDDNFCTLDTCDEFGGCIHTQPPGLPCHDGNACTEDDKCYQGLCQSGLPVDCDDDNVCTTDSCNPDSGCVYVTVGPESCDDNNACTADDHCIGGVCEGTYQGCDDSSPCTDDTCDTAIGCIFTPLDIPCDDQDVCTEGDHCVDGDCQPGWNPQCLVFERLVLAGDSWSTGLIQPLRDELDERGYEEIVVSWETTSKPGSKVSGWVTNPDLMNGLYSALAMDPPAGMLIFTLTGNDYLGAGKGGLGLLGPQGWFFAMTAIQLDLITFVALVRAHAPNVKIVLVGYDYLHFEMIELLGSKFPGMNLITFNLGLIDLATRERDVATATGDMIYAHNMGLLQHTYGDYFHPPFICPNPVMGCPEYGPGQAPKPGPAPGYNPFPGGWYTYPSPVDYVPDGVHPSYDGFRAIIDNSLDQVPKEWFQE